jgi:hypothetical protein
MKTLLNVSFRVFALLVAAYCTVQLRRELLPFGVATTFDENGMFRYAIVFVASLGMFVVMMIFGELGVRWMNGGNPFSQKNT